MTNRILAATLLVALTTLPAFAASTMPSTGPAPTGGPVVTTGGEIDSPGEPFHPDVTPGPRRGGKMSPYDLTCEIQVDRDGTWQLIVTNNGQPIPKGYDVVIKTKYGKLLILNLKYDSWSNGETNTKGFIGGPDFLPAGGAFDCTASVEMQPGIEPLQRAGVDEPAFSTDPKRRGEEDSPKIADPGYTPETSPWEVSCHFDDGIIFVKNEGNVPIPEGTWVALSYPVNQVKHFQIDQLKPGYSTGRTLAASEAEGFTCGAWVWKDAEVPQINEAVAP